MCANSALLNGTLRTTWRFSGYVTSDCGAISNVAVPEPRGHGFTHGDAAKAGGISVAAGTDVDCGGVYKNADTGLNASMAARDVTQAQVDTSLERLTQMQLKLGLFDPKTEQPYFHYGKPGSNCVFLFQRQ